MTEKFIQKENKFEGRQDALETNLKSIWRELMFADPLGFDEKIKPFEAEIKKRFPDYLDYRLFHVFVGSTTDIDWPKDHFDFPGEYSVENFIKNAQREMKGGDGN